MKLNTPEIAWHGKEPVLSIDFCKTGSLLRLASAGADKTIKMWSLVCKEEGSCKLEFLANLSRHTKAVNVVRFAPKEELLASAGDDSVVFIWKLSSSQEQLGPCLMECDDEAENRESWTVSKMLRGHIEDVYDLAWSPDGSQLISGSVDNSAIIWDVNRGVKLTILKDHKHYVQGVCWDPLGQYVVTNSSDRSCRLYNPQTYRCLFNINKLSGTTKASENGEPMKQMKMFHDETMLSFFRRPSFTPDGSLLIVPAGRLELQNQVVHTTFVFTRGSPNKPVWYLQSPKKPTVAVRCCPILFEHRTLKESEKENGQKSPPLLQTPYKMVFAVATLDDVLLYDTQQKQPFGFVSNIHYATLSDITWSNNGLVLVVSSIDGYCSIIQFKDGELGTPYKQSLQEIIERPVAPVNTPISSKQNNSGKGTALSTPLGTPTESSKTGKTARRIMVTPVASDKMPNIDNADKPEQESAGPKKKEPRGINQFTVPMSQIKTDKPVVTPRRVQLMSSGQAPASTNPGSNAISQAGQPRVQLITIPGQMANILSQAGSSHVQLISVPGQKVTAGSQTQQNQMQSVTLPTGQTIVTPGQIVSHMHPHKVQPVTITPGQNSVGTGQIGMARNVNQNGPRRIPLVSLSQGVQSTGQTVVRMTNQTPRNVQLISTAPSQAVPNTGTRLIHNTVNQMGTTSDQQGSLTQGQGSVNGKRSASQLLVSSSSSPSHVQLTSSATDDSSIKAQQPRRIQLITVAPQSQRPTFSPSSNVPVSSKAIRSGESVDSHTSTNQQVSLGNTATVAKLSSAPTVAATARRVQLITLAPGRNGVLTSQDVQPLTSANSNKDTTAAGSVDVNEGKTVQERRISLTSISPGNEHSDQNVSENRFSGKKPIPLEPNIIVVD